jgi:multidrug transporter EmrE-like cation transporter
MLLLNMLFVSSLLVISNIILKFYISNNSINDLSSLSDYWSYFQSFLLSYYFWIFLSVSLTSLLLWIKVLSKFEISTAYPLISISYILMLIPGYLLFNENINFLKILGVILIFCGVFVLSKFT